MMIMCPVWFVLHVWLRIDISALLQSALDAERLIVGTEMRSRPNLVLVETQLYFIISWFHALGSPANLSSISRVPDAGKHSSTQRMVEGSGCQKEQEQMGGTILDIFVQFPPPIPPVLLYHSSPFSQAAA